MQHGGRGELSIGSTKTGKGRRVVLPAFLADELAAHLSTTYTKVTKPTDPLFAGEFKADTYHRHNNFYLRHFKPAVKAALPPEKHALRFHDLRHTAASLALSVPAPTFTWSRRMLGHASITMTVDLYGHLLPETQRDLADGLDAIYTTANSERPA